MYLINSKFNLPKRQKPERKLELIVEFKEWFYSSAFMDWVEVEGELTLTGYSPSPELENILANKIDVQLEYYSPIIDENRN